jgi:diguanylate cyclase (GGDEF)-like protein
VLNLESKSLKSRIINNIIITGTLLIVIIYTSLYFINIEKSKNFNIKKIETLISVIKEDLLKEPEKTIKKIIEADKYIKEIIYKNKKYKGNDFNEKESIRKNFGEITIIYGERVYYEYISALKIRMAIVAIAFYLLIILISKKINLLLTPFNEIVTFFKGIDIENPKKLKFNSKVVSREFIIVQKEINNLGKKIKESTEKINFLAYNDELTKLLNRRAYYKEIANSKDRALLFLDLDGFKDINDIYGHKAGDFILEKIGERLSIYKENENIFRVGGDEFIILINSKNKEEIIKECKDIISIVSEEVIYNKTTILKISTSIGISIIDKEDTDKERALKEADIAMYEAKNAGKNQYKFFEEYMFKKIKDKNKLLEELKEATINEDFTFVVQPQINIETNKVSGAEALIRWEKNKKLISPYYFIKELEESIFITPVTNQIIKQVMEYAKELNDKNIKFGRISINLPEQVFNKKGFLLDLNRIQKETKCPTNLIEFEITERWISIENETIKGNLQLLIDLGYELSIDDFGEDNSSFKRTDILPIQKIKLDKNFSDRLFEERSSKHSIKTILTYSELTNRRFLIEGIETKEQLDKIKEIGVKHVQGYYFYKPLKKEEFIKIFK